MNLGKLDVLTFYKHYRAKTKKNQKVSLSDISLETQSHIFKKIQGPPKMIF